MPVYRLPETDPLFPDPAEAEPDGLLAVGGDLSPGRLIQAYAAGIFPWYPTGSPILWWSPDPRCLLFPGELHVPRSLRKVLRDKVFHLSTDTAFAEVITACAQNRRNQDGTWLVPEMIEAYIALYRLGLAHSVEARQDGRLVGGLYGVSLGGAFFGESMFYRIPNASKAAVVFLAEVLSGAGFSFIDCQQETPNLLRFGAKPVPRGEFLALLEKALRRETPRGRWEADNGAPV